MVVVGRHPLCDVRLDSLRISRHHCCMTQDNEEVVVRDLGSTNGIRINGERVERGRLRPGDELSIAHIRYRLENGNVQEMTLADPNAALSMIDPKGAPHLMGRLAMAGELIGGSKAGGSKGPATPAALPHPEVGMLEKPLGEVVRNALGGLPDKCRIQVIVQMKNDPEESASDVSDES